MEAVVVGVLTAITVGLGTVFWYLLVAPERVMVLFGDLSDEWFEGDGGGSVRALTWALGIVVFLCAFLTGGVVAFLARTL